MYLEGDRGGGLHVKGFCTWAGTVLAAQMLRDFESFDTEAQAKRNIVRAVESVAKKLGNTKAVCRRCYIHPAILDAYVDGSMLKTLAVPVRRTKVNDLTEAEAAVLGFLQRRLARETRARAS